MILLTQAKGRIGRTAAHYKECGAVDPHLHGSLDTVELRLKCAAGRLGGIRPPIPRHGEAPGEFVAGVAGDPTLIQLTAARLPVARSACRHPEQHAPDKAAS